MTRRARKTKVEWKKMEGRKNRRRMGERMKRSGSMKNYTYW